MQESRDNIKEQVTNYLSEEFFADEPEVMENPEGFLSEGLIDSLSVMVLVEFIEKKYGFEFEPHEVDADNLDSVDKITDFIQRRLAG